jgi:hypothetical protein
MIDPSAVLPWCLEQGLTREPARSPAPAPPVARRFDEKLSLRPLPAPDL